MGRSYYLITLITTVFVLLFGHCMLNKWVLFFLWLLPADIGASLLGTQGSWNTGQGLEGQALQFHVPALSDLVGAKEV